ncbi:MAG: NUDIX hydrolase [Pseudomonadota bacterium]
MKLKKQYAALPYKHSKSGNRFLLITSRESRRWVVPKGWPMGSRPAEDVAQIEAAEEAGVVGEIQKRPAGSFRYKKIFPDKKISCEVAVYPLKVADLKDEWKEKAERTRRWFSAKEAAALVREPELSELILEIDKRFIKKRKKQPKKLQKKSKTFKRG